MNIIILNPENIKLHPSTLKQVENMYSNYQIKEFVIGEKFKYDNSWMYPIYYIVNEDQKEIKKHLINVFC